MRKTIQLIRPILFLVAGCASNPPAEPPATIKPVTGTTPEPPTEIVSEAQSQAAENKPWYSGGTLHNAKMNEWSRSSYADRLATSADFVTKLMQVDEMEVPSVDRLKPLAKMMERNISAANADGLANSQNVATVAATCWILMKE